MVSEPKFCDLRPKLGLNICKAGSHFWCANGFREVSNSKIKRLKEPGGVNLTDLEKESEAFPVSLLVLGTGQQQRFLRG